MTLTALLFVQCIRASRHQAVAAISSSSRGAATRKVSYEHRALIDAALERNEEAVVAVITSHIRRTIKAVSGALRKRQGEEGNA